MWLDTLSKDHALSFLATHLKKGNLMIGAAREEMESGEFTTKVGSKKNKKTLHDGQTTLGFDDYSKTIYDYNMKSSRTLKDGFGSLSMS